MFLEWLLSIISLVVFSVLLMVFVRFCDKHEKKVFEYKVSYILDEIEKRKSNIDNK